MTVLIVDDEKLIRNWLTIMLNQLSEPKIEVLAVCDVDEALACCSQNDIQLVITDITMPQRSGLELLQILKEQYPQIKAAVLSAYDEYEYIRAAMRLGAIDYILKGEMGLDDIQSLLHKVELFSGDIVTPATKDTFLKKGSNLENFLCDAETLESFLKNTNPELAMENVITIPFALSKELNVENETVKEICNKTMVSEGVIGSTFQMRDEFLIIYNDPNYPHHTAHLEKIKLLLERNLYSFIQQDIEINRPFSSSDIENLLKNLTQPVEQIQFPSNCGVQEGLESDNSINTDIIRLVTEKICQLLELQHYQDAADYLVQSLNRFLQSGMSTKEFRAVLHHCIAILYFNTTELKTNAGFAAYYQETILRLARADTAETASALVQKICSRYKGELNNPKCYSISPSLRRVIEFIDKNYMQHLPLEDVARNVFLNKTYISQLFMSKLGISFATYLEGVRVFKAQELLQNTEMTVSKIAEEVGYSSQSYFTKAFKKRVGVAPLQYRAMFYSRI